MSDFKPGELVWWWDGADSQPTSGIVLEVHEALSSPIFASIDPLINYVVLANGRRRLLIEDRLNKSCEDCKRPTLSTEDIVSAQPMATPSSKSLFKWKRKGESNE